MLTIDIEQENKTLLRKYRALLRKAKPLLKNYEEDSKQIRKAFKFAVDAHKDMRRKSGEPYIYHPLDVATIVVEEIGLGKTSIIAALLHDVVEDTEWELKDIEERFGTKVAKIIDGLTKISATASKGRSLQAENFRKMLLTISEDIRVVLVKIADRLHNMRTLDSMPKDKQLKIKSETEYIYAPLAHRLGLYNIKSELEDLCLKYSDRSVYDEITEKIEQTQTVRNRFIQNFIKPIRADLKRQGFEFKIKSRTKSIRSIYNKMKRQGVSFEQVYDLFAIRIIFQSIREVEKTGCWKIYSVVTDHYTPNVNRLRDWISVPKANGYESLHTTVMGPKGQWVEVQIRSERMDEIAEKGYAAHWKYKDNSNDKGDQGIEGWLNRVRQLLEDNNTSAIEFLDDFRANLFNKEVFTFTPKGDLKVFPGGATVLDFAFEIHTEVGARCLGAKINGRLVPLNYKLQNGDQVEILTSNKPKANEDWFKFVTTGKARSKIKEYLKEDKKRIASMGKEIVARKLKHLKLPMNDQVVRQMMEYFNLKTETEFYFQVGEGIIEHNQLKRFQEKKKKQDNTPKIRPTDAKEFKQKIREIRKGEDELVIGEDIDNVDYSLAPCCNPIPGDDIFGFTTVSSGIKIHRTNCPNAVAMMANYGYRIIKARWSSLQDKQFDVHINIEGTDRMGIVNDVTRIISSQMRVNIKSIRFETRNSIFEGDISLLVHDTKEVSRIAKLLEGIEGVIKVKRLE
ncbi:bifunctional (p)ppGpp synthetase/guanosine-3',5'-bis(diphosphate) 3'-pyrophosphohydrolase [Rapidithrix thailandica]|uniref:Bifunctional (P)ppGpp synthetase/guanosine-3',5'-bis(Diphosphate) 3'-pyrophosphohydrolase n=1 Tax=Rapidithrix thailandica TaxID=413964 RepID=A0AAW9S8C7_9BACT